MASTIINDDLKEENLQQEDKLEFLQRSRNQLVKSMMSPGKYDNRQKVSCIE